MLHETHTLTGVAYELHAWEGRKHEASIRVFDADAGEVVSNTFYPTMAQARGAYAKTLRIACANALEDDENGTGS